MKTFPKVTHLLLLRDTRRRLLSIIKTSIINTKWYNMIHIFIPHISSTIYGWCVFIYTVASWHYSNVSNQITHLTHQHYITHPQTCFNKSDFSRIISELYSLLTLLDTLVLSVPNKNLNKINSQMLIPSPECYMYKWHKMVYVHSEKSGLTTPFVLFFYVFHLTM